MEDLNWQIGPGFLKSQVKGIDNENITVGGELRNGSDSLADEVDEIEVESSESVAQ